MLKGSIEARPPSHSGFNWDEHESYPQTTLSPNIEALQLELALTLGLRLRLEMGSCSSGNVALPQPMLSSNVEVLRL